MFDIYLGGEVAACLELLEEGRHYDSGEEEDHAPEEDIGDVGTMGTAGAALKLPVQYLTLLQAPENMMMMNMVKVAIMNQCFMPLCFHTTSFLLLSAVHNLYYCVTTAASVFMDIQSIQND